MADISDVRLEALLRSTLRAEEAALSVTLRPEAILLRRSRVRQEWIRRSGMRLLLVAAALVLPLAGLLVVTGRPTAAPPTYRAVILHGGAVEPEPAVRDDLEVLVVDPDGHVETVAVVPAAHFPNDVIPTADGWLTHGGTLGVRAYHGSTGAYATVDLHDLSADPIIGLTDPRPVPDALPTFADPVSPRYGELRTCRFTGPEFRRPCKGRTDRAVESGSEEVGNLRAWLPRGPEDVTYEGATWAADGGIWVLQDDRRDGRRALSFVHVDPAGNGTPGMSFGLPAGQDLYLIGLAPDDSLAAVQLFDGPSSETLLVNPATGVAVSAAGPLLGFADDADAVELPRVAGSIERFEPLHASVGPAYRPLESLEQQVSVLPGNEVLLAHEASSDGPHLDYDTGIVRFRDGLALSTECVGPGTLTAEVFDGSRTEVIGGTDTDCVYSRRDGFMGVEGDPREVSVKVHTDGQVHWRLVIVEVPRASPDP